MFGFGLGGSDGPRAADRFGVWMPLVLGGVVLGSGYAVAGLADSLLLFELAQGLLIDSSATLDR
jgi:hypothetical protein